MESSDDFGAELKKHCVHAVDDAKYKEMVTEQVDNGEKVLEIIFCVQD